MPRVLDDVTEGSKLIIFLVAVHPVIDGDKMNIMLREEYFRVHTYLQIITAQAGHILDDNPLWLCA